MALDYETGRRVVFGAPGAPAAGLSDAVLASCAIPGWFEPVTIGGHRYVDGGMWSATNVDLLAEAGLDEIFVLAPMRRRPTMLRGTGGRGWNVGCGWPVPAVAWRRPERCNCEERPSPFLAPVRRICS